MEWNSVRTLYEDAAMESLLGLRSDAKKQRLPQPKRALATSPPLGGVSECFRGRSSDSQAHSYLPDFPGLSPSVILGVRTCLPLRGSSGFSPDSLFILLAGRNLGGHHHILGCWPPQVH